MRDFCSETALIRECVFRYMTEAAAGLCYEDMRRERNREDRADRADIEGKADKQRRRGGMCFLRQSRHRRRQKHMKEEWEIRFGSIQAKWKKTLLR